MAISCVSCPLKAGCYGVAASQPKDVIGFPCGNVGGYSQHLVFWISSEEEWKKVNGTANPPKDIEWCKLKEEPKYYD